MLKTYGHLSEAHKAVLGSAAHNYDNPNLVKRGLNIYQGVLNAGGAYSMREQNTEDRGFYSELRALVTADTSLSEALQILRERRTGALSGANKGRHIWSRFGPSGTLTVGTGGSGGSDDFDLPAAKLAFNEKLAGSIITSGIYALTSWFPANLAAYAAEATGLAISTIGLEPENLPVAFYLDGQARATALMESNYVGTADDVTDQVAEGMPRDWQKSEFVWTGQVPHDGYNMTKYALEKYIPAKDIESANSALRKQLADLKLPFDLGEVELGENVKLKVFEENRPNGLPTYRVFFRSPRGWTPLVSPVGQVIFNIDRLVAELPKVEPSNWNSKEFWLEIEGLTSDGLDNLMERHAKNVVNTLAVAVPLIQSAVDLVKSPDAKELLAEIMEHVNTVKTVGSIAKEDLSRRLPRIFRKLRDAIPETSPEGQARLDMVQAWVNENVPQGNMDDFMAFMARPEVRALATAALGEGAVEVIRALPQRIEEDIAYQSERIQRDVSAVKANLEWLMAIFPGRVSADFDSIASWSQETADEAFGALSSAYDGAIVQAQADGMISTEVAEVLSELPMDIANMTRESMNTMRLAIPAPVRLMWDSFDPGIVDRGFEGSEPRAEYTGEDLRPGVVDTMIRAAQTALQGGALEVGGRVLVMPRHYPITARGLAVGILIEGNLSTHDRGLRDTFYGRTALGWSRMFSDMTTDAVVQTAYSLGVFELRRDETGYYVDEVFETGSFQPGSLMDTMRMVTARGRGVSEKSAVGPRIYVRLSAGALELHGLPYVMDEQD
jgi:hypothetical protein